MQRAIIGESLSLNLQQLLLFGMSDPHKNEDNKQYNHHLQIDDTSKFLSLGSPNASVSQGRDREENGGRSEEFSNDQEYFPDAIEEEENKPDDIELYEAESINLQDIEDEEDKAEKSIASASKREFLQLPMPPKQPHKLMVTDEQKMLKTKKKRKGRKKVNDSQQQEYSGEYGPNKKKNKVKDIKKSGKRNQTTRSRGKPRGRGSHASKLSQVKKEYVYDDCEKNHQRLRNIPSKKNETIVQPPSYILAPFNSSWRIAEENQVDWDSENASVWSESANRRADYADEIISLIEKNPENIVALIAALPPLFYTTLN